MQLSFLCAKHSDWVYGHPQEASYFLARDEMQGTDLFYAGEYRECIPYLGCAFDITAILLEVEEGQNHLLIDKMFSLSALLSDAYTELGLVEYQAAINRRVTQLVTALSFQECSATGRLAEAGLFGSCKH